MIDNKLMRGFPAWAIKWESKNEHGEHSAHFIFNANDGPVKVRLFYTREEARAFVKKEFGYISKRKDLRAPPYGWRVPKPIRVSVMIKEL